MDNPLVSICIPTYNGAQYLRQCLDSVLSQSLSNFEVIIVDDQSSDETWNMISRYAEQDSRIRLFRNSNNLGLVGNWNQCLDLAKGDWIKFVFQDDFITFDCIEKMINASTTNLAPFSVCQREFVFEGVSNSIIELYKRSIEATNKINLPDKRKLSAEDFCNILIPHSTQNFIGEPTSVLFHKDMIKRYGRFNSELIQICDLEYWARIACNEGLLFIPETLAYFRVHESSATFLNEKRSYSKRVIDPVKLMCEYAYGNHYKILKKVALDNGINIKLRFRANLLDSQINAYHESQKTENSIDLWKEWQNVQSSYSCLNVSKNISRHIAILFKRMERKILYTFFSSYIK